jgi:hypothetical protein
MGWKFQKPDANQETIVRELKQLGYQVDDVHGVRGLGYDIVVTGRIFGSDRIATVRVEIKGEKGTLTPAEKKYHESSAHRETLIIAKSTEDVLDWFWRV